MKVQIFSWEVDVYWPRKRPDQVFVRFGLWEPRTNQSLNFATGKQERGLSVYPADLSEDLVVSIAEDFDVCELVEGRLAFAVTGRVVGMGSDGEPLLKSVRCLPYPLDVGTKQRIPPAAIERQQGVPRYLKVNSW